MFASKTPRDLNADPQPILLQGYRYGDREMRFTREEAPWAQPWMEHAIEDPRPEYDHAQHNKPNPILLEFRQSCEDEADLDGWFECLRTALIDPGDWGLPVSVYDGTDEEVVHAYHVVARLVTMQENA